MCNQVTKSKRIRQVEEETKKRIIASKAAIESALFSLKIKDLEVLSLIVNHRSNNKFLYASQKTIGKWLSCDERTIRRSVAALRSVGFALVYRKYPETNMYSIPEFFYIDEIQKLLKKWITPIGKLFTKPVLILKNFLYNSVSDNNINLKKRADAFKKAPTKEELKVGIGSLLEHWKSQEEKLGIPVPNV